MKKLVLLIVVSLFYVSNLTAQKNNPYDYVGQEHNKGLDYIYQKLIKRGKNNKFTKKSFKTFVVNAISEFMSRNKKVNINSLKKNINDIIIYPFPPPLSPTFPNIPVKYKVSSQLDFTLKDIFNTAKRGNEKDIVELVDNIKKGKLSQKDKEIALSVASVSYHTIIYWKNGKNISKWQSLSHGNGQAKYGIGGLFGADVGGAIGGAIAGSVLPLAGTAVGAASGALGGSGAYAGAWLGSLFD